MDNAEAAGREFAGRHLLFFDTAGGRVTRNLTCWDCTQLLALREQAGARRPA